MTELQNTIMVTIAILIGSFFSYLLQFFLGRSLSIADFGTFNTLLSITAIVGVPASVFGTSLIKKTATLFAEKNLDKIRALFWHSIIWSLALGLIFFGFFYIFQSDIFGYLRISDQKLILAFTTYMCLSFLWAIPYYFMQGLLKYKWFAFIIIFSNILRFAAPLGLLFVDNNVMNVFVGIIFGLTLSFGISLLILKKDVLPFSNVSVQKDLLFILKFSLPVMAVNLCLMSFVNSDLILVRSQFDEQQAGYFAGVITLGKILLFGCTPVATVMYPKIASAVANGRSLHTLFKKFFGIQLLVTFFGLVAFAIFPKIIALGFFGHKFLESVNYLPLYAIAIALYVLINFLMLFLLAVDKTYFYKILIFLAFTQIILVNNYTHNLYQVIYVDIAIFFVSFCALLFFALKFLRNNQ